MNINYNDQFELQLLLETYWNKAVQGTLESEELEDLLKRLQVLCDAYKLME